MKRNRAIAVLAATALAGASASGCSTAFADFDDATPQSAGYPDFADLPPEPGGVPTREEWDARVDRLVAERERLAEARAAALDRPLESPEAVAAEARAKADPNGR